MNNLRKMISDTVWNLKLELPEQILEKLYEHRSVAEYVTLTEAFDNVSFEILYEKATILYQSKLIEFYTAPEAYAVFNEPDFIKAKIRAEGIQYWKDHCSFLRKQKTPLRIAASGLALIVCAYLIHITFISGGSIRSENGAPQQSQSVPSSDSVTAKLNSPITPPKSPLSTGENRDKSNGVIKEAVKSSLNDTAEVISQRQKDTMAGGTKKGSGDQKGAVDLNHNYTIELDTLNHLVKVSPRDGKWDSTVLAIPLSEKEFVQPEFRQSNTLDGADFAFDALGLRFSGIMSTTSPASEDVYYMLHYVNKPTVFLFGNYPNSLYPYYFKK